MINKFLEIETIDVYYGAVAALNQASLCIEKGEIVTIIGANGAGKSTIINTISGILKPVKGVIRFQGLVINGGKPKKIVQLGISQIPEGSRVFPYLTVNENLKMGAYSRKDNDEIQNSLNEVFNYFPMLKDKKKDLASSLSGGQRQMLAIGRALMSNPILLMMDEPSLGLSPIMCQEVVKIIKKINSNGVTVLLVEQNANLALKIADRAYVLEIGKIVKEGPGKLLLCDPEVKKAYLGN